MSACEYVHVCVGAHGGQKRWIPAAGVIGSCEHSLWVLGTEFGFLERTASALDC